jgi:uncharacterized protein YjdB
MIKYGQILLLVLAVFIIGCDGDDPVSTTPQVTTITITGDNEITVGATTTLTATVTEDEATQTVTWASSDASIATINESGLVTAVAEGGVTITATSTEATNISATFAITVTVPVDPTAPAVNSVSLTGVDSVPVDAFTQLTATVDAVNGAAETVTWSTSDAAIAVVNPLGFVTGISTGTATITATSTADATKFGTFAMKVINGVVEGISIEGLGSILQGETTQLTVDYTFLGSSSGLDTSVTWASSNTGILTVDASGNVTSVSSGSATITATLVSNNSITATHVVNVVATGLAAYWSMDSLTADDKLADSLGGYHATNNDGATPTLEAGLFGQALRGSRVPYVLDSTLAVTGGGYVMSFWYKADDFTTVTNTEVPFSFSEVNTGLTAPEGNVTFYQGIMRLFVGNANGGNLVLANNALADNNWHHYIMGTTADNNAVLYIDGVLQNSAPAGSWVPNIKYIARVNGLIDEMRVYRGALTAAQVAELSAMP